jgi:hypothetical protein
MGEAETGALRTLADGALERAVICARAAVAALATAVSGVAVGSAAVGVAAVGVAAVGVAAVSDVDRYDI